MANLERPPGDFKLRVEALVKAIPKGRVMTYGQIAALAGHPRAARMVGGIAHYGDPELPWQRVVNRFGGLASGYPGGRRGHLEALRLDGLAVSSEMKVDLESLLWWPSLKEPPLLVIVGQTATGKSALALKIAQNFNGEIICADSLTLRRGVDIGSAKPSKADRLAIKHHLVDIIEPCQPFTVADFKKLAEAAIDDIKARGKLPIMVGGSGLYVDSVLYGYSFLPRGREVRRQELIGLGAKELAELARSLGLDTSGVDASNPRRLIRLIESGGAKPTKRALRGDAVVVGLSVDKERLKKRVTSRTSQMLKAGLKDEVKNLVDRYGWECEALRAIGYAQWQDYFEGQSSLSQTRRLIDKATLDLAKRQATWFKRNKSIHWFTTPVKWSPLVDLLTTLLQA